MSLGETLSARSEWQQPQSWYHFCPCFKLPLLHSFFSHVIVVCDNSRMALCFPNPESFPHATNLISHSIPECVMANSREFHSENNFYHQTSAYTSLMVWRGLHKAKEEEKNETITTLNDMIFHITVDWSVRWRKETARFLALLGKCRLMIWQRRR